MEYFEAICSAVFNIFSLYVNVRVIKLFLPQKRVKTGIALLVYFATWVLNWLVYYNLHVYILTTLSLFCGLVFIVCVLYEGSIWKKIVAVVSSMAFTFVAEEITWRVLNALGVGIDNEAAGSLWSTLLALGIILIIGKHVSFDKDTRLPVGSYFSLFLVAGGNMILTYLPIEADMSHPYAVIALSVLCLINVGMYSLYESVVESYRDKVQAAVMKQQIEMYDNQFEIINQSQQNIRSLKHDMHNHLLNINSNLQNERYEDTQKYIARMESALEVPKEHVRTGNLAIDGIMNYKLEQIKALGCVPVIEIDVPEERFMPDFDLTVIMGNLLDNVIEALEKAEKKFLGISIRYAKGVLYISMCNSYYGILKSNGTKLLSIKKDETNHGIGLYNIENIVNKYNGDMKINCSESIYRINLILYI